ncbi:MAG TPA: lysophospholipid acyltransferase family protein [Xanthomonadaceae bacterium]|jgi:1-acyl-sn-glycerol-3-phosphate acyltransferase|nr:lysophospholipid acyltransferase family protein [Xanthomonadaceae bacterium]
MPPIDPIASVDPIAARGDWLRPLRYALRTPMLVLHLLLSLPVTLLLIGLPIARLRLRSGERVDHRAIRAWSAGLMRIFGFRLRLHGKPLPGAALFVANHVSWIDITLMHSQHAVGFVAKDEISRWPLIGWLGARAGTIYHRRGSDHSLRDVMQQMVARMRAGFAIGVFPEGATGNGQQLRVFHARILQTAVDANVPVQPVALCYGERGNAQTVVAFAPGEPFLLNFLRLLGDRSRTAEVHFLEPVAAVAGGRRGMAELARRRIGEALAG